MYRQYFSVIAGLGTSARSSLRSIGLTRHLPVGETDRSESKGHLLLLICHSWSATHQLPNLVNLSLFIHGNIALHIFVKYKENK